MAPAREAVTNTGERGGDSWLLFRRAQGSGSADLLLARANPNERSSAQWLKTVLVPGVRGDGGSPERSAPFGGMNYYWVDEQSVVDFRPPDQRRRKVCADIFAWYGLMLQENVTEFETTARGEYLAFETPFVEWPVRCPTMLPGDRVVFQLGDQVVIADLQTRRIAFVARGRGPAVVLESGPGRSMPAGDPHPK